MDVPGFEERGKPGPSDLRHRQKTLGPGFRRGDGPKLIARHAMCLNANPA
jgi:hypothetical protein